MPDTTTTPTKNKMVAITPARLDSNSFAKSFSDAVVKTGRCVSDSKWNFRCMVKADVVILHWPDCFFLVRTQKESRRKLLKIRIARRLFGTRFIWVAHNVAPHGDGDESRYAGAFINELDGIVHLCAAGSKAINTQYKVPASTKQITTVHGRYEGKVVATGFATPSEVEPVKLLTLGLLKPYKSIEIAVDAMMQIKPNEAKLRVLGKDCDSSYVDELRARASQISTVSIDTRDELMTLEETEQALDDCHLFVIPYGRILNSGAAIHALSRNRPVLAPNVGGLPELQERLGREWVYLYDTHLSGETLKDALDWVRSTRRPDAPDLGAYSWTQVSQDLNRLLSTT